jgi:hypothetical protein
MNVLFEIKMNAIMSKDFFKNINPFIDTFKILLRDWIFEMPLKKQKNVIADNINFQINNINRECEYTVFLMNENGWIDETTFRFIDEDDFNQELKDRVDESLPYYYTDIIVRNLRTNIKFDTENLTIEDLMEDHKTEKDFKTDECPCCMENEPDFLGFCGHRICFECIDKLQNNKDEIFCPYCREDWSIYIPNDDMITDYENIEKYIETLKNNEDREAIKSLINFNELITDVIETAGHNEIMNAYDVLFFECDNELSYVCIISE